MALHLVTGGSGFLGANIARLLRDRGESVRVLDVARDGDAPADVEFMCGDINDRESVARAMKGVDYVHHNVALVPVAKAGSRFWTVNVDGTRTTLDEALRAHVKMFCHMSSSAVFGSQSVMPIKSTTPAAPMEAYGRAKLAAEHLVSEAGRQGMAVSIIRPRTIVGPRRLGIFAILFEWIRDNANIVVIGSGHHLFQFAHVDDIAEVSIRCCLQQTRGVFNVGAETFGTLREDLEALIRHAGKSSRVKSVPSWLAIGMLMLLDKLRLSPLGPYHYLAYGKQYYFDIEPVKAALGWRPRYSNVEILTSAYDWFVGQRSLEASSNEATNRAVVNQKLLRLVKRLV